MDADKKEKCHAIIHTASAATAGVAAGLAQIPLTDGALIVPIQITMIVGLGKVFDVEITESVAKAVALSMAAMYVGRAISQVLVGWIPVLGNMVNSATAAGITEAMGWAVAKKLDKGIALT